MLSYPRTASSFIRYAIEKIVKRPTQDCGGRLDKVYGDDMNYRDKTPLLRKEHFINSVRKNDVDKLILLLRNYKDVFISHDLRNVFLSEQNEIYNKLYGCDKFFLEYYKLINFYEEFKGPKMLIYYEDIKDNKVNIIKDVINFLLPNQNIEVDDNTIDELEKDSKNKYKSRDGSRSDKRKDLHTVLNDEQNEKIDKKFRNYNTELYDKYLNRYKK